VQAARAFACEATVGNAQLKGRSRTKSKLARILDRLEKAYGKQKPTEPDDAYELVLHRLAGYPQSDANCAKGFAALKSRIGLKPADILQASDADLRNALREGGIVPELRARRLKEIAASVEREYGGDLGAVLKRPLAEAKKALKKFPTIGDSGAEKILLFTRTAPVAALPSNCLDVPLRLGYGRASKNWALSYREAQEAIRAELPEDCDAQIRAYLLLKRHGQEVCRRRRPLCEQCCVSDECRYFQSTRIDSSHA
jgi:endonuclease III